MSQHFFLLYGFYKHPTCLNCFNSKDNLSEVITNLPRPQNIHFVSLIYSNTITYSHVLNSFPYKNTVDLVELKGTDLLKVFERVASMYSKRKPSVSFLQVSGKLFFIHHPDRNRVCLKDVLKAITQQYQRKRYIKR